MLTGPADTVGKAKRLRATMSPPEVRLWQALRRRPGGHKFRRQHPAGPYVLDFACVGARLAIEIDGAVHEMGNHARRDQLRDDWLALQGYRTLRIAARDVLHELEAVVAMIVAECGAAPPLRRRCALPPPRPGEE